MPKLNCQQVGTKIIEAVYHPPDRHFDLLKREFDAVVNLHLKRKV